MSFAGEQDSVSIDLLQGLESTGLSCLPEQQSLSVERWLWLFNLWVMEMTALPDQVHPSFPMQNS